MSFTKVTSAGIGSTELVTLDSLEVINNASIGGVLTYEDVTNVDSIGIITARAGVLVGSGITLSKDGDIFATGITTVSGNVKVGTGITLSPDGDVFFTGVGTGNGSGLTALNASNLGSGTVPTARLGSGTASSSTFLRGDSTFQTVNTDLVSDTSPQLGGDLASNGNDITMADTDKVILGTGSDLLIYHQSTQNFIRGSATASPLYIDCCENVNIRHLDTDGSNAEDMIKAVGDGAVELYHDNSKKIETTSTGITISGSDTTGSIVQGDFRLKTASGTQHVVYDASASRINFADNVSATFGDANDIQIFHDGTNNVVKNTTTAELRFMYDTQYMLRCIPQAAVRIYYANSTKAQTTNTGFMVNGNLELVDNDKLYLGASGDFQMYHDGTDNIFQSSGLKNFIFKPKDTDVGLKIIGDGAVELYYDNSKKLETFSTGVKMESSSDVELRITKTASSDAQIFNDNALNLCCSSGGADGQMVKIKTGAATNSLVEHMRVTGAGHCQFHYFDSTIPGLSNTSLGACVEKISGTNGSAIFVSRQDAQCLFLNRNTSGVIVSFRQSGSEVGTISTNGNSLPSDRNFKKNITDLTLGLNFVNTLKPSKFNLKLEEDTDPLIFGLIAQDVEEALTAAGVEKNSVVLCQHNPTESEAESDYNLDYGKLIPVLINAVQELTAKNDALEARIKTLEG